MNMLKQPPTTTRGSADPPENSPRAIQRWLVRGWFILFPCFAALTFEMCFERTCRDPYDLLPAVTSRPLLAWPVALLYVTAHVWAIAAYLLTVSATQRLVPTSQEYRAVWAGDTGKPALMLAVLVIEYLPLAWWRLVGTVIGCGI